MVTTLLPPNGTPMLRAFEQAVAYEPRVNLGVELIPNVKGRRLPSYLQFLLWEYGLIELVPHLPNPHVLIDEGRPWQIERDTFAAVARALGWLSTPASIVEAPGRRQWWNAFQLYLDALPPADVPTLDRIDRVSRLSKPFRSDFRRGVQGYDAPAVELGYTRLGDARLADDSGVRLWAAGPKWSFGRAYETSHTLTEVEGTALGIWLEPTEDGVKWADMHLPWVSAEFPWATEGAALRRSLMASFFPSHTAHIALKEAGGDVIGYRRARLIHAVNAEVGGAYTIGGLAYGPSASGEAVLIEAFTEAGDGAGETVATAEIIIDGVLAEGVPIGRRWLSPDQLSGGTAIAETNFSIPLRATVRERITFLVRF